MAEVPDTTVSEIPEYRKGKSDVGISRATHARLYHGVKVRGYRQEVEVLKLHKGGSNRTMQG